MSDNPYYRQSIAELFEPDVKWIAVMNGRDCPSGLMAFGYPEDRYGYLTFTAIDYDDIPRLITLTESKGFVLANLYDGLNDPYAPAEYDGRSFSYSIPGAKWWTDFIEGVRA